MQAAFYNKLTLYELKPDWKTSISAISIPKFFIGTASDRYAGWLGQIYSHDRYQGRITKRTKIMAGKSFTEEVLPVDSVEEYFEHFPVLEIDFTFYRPLLDQNGQPTQNYAGVEELR